MKRSRSIVDRMLIWAVTVALFGAASHLAYAADDTEGPVYGKRQKPPPYSFDRITGYFSLITRASEDESTSSNGQKTTSKEISFEESLTLHTAGYIIHPNLVDLNLTGTFGLTQENLETNGDSTRQNGTLYTWDASATFLRSSSAPLTLYSSQSRNIVDRTFGATLEDTTTTYGALWTIRSPKYPTEFRVYHTEESQAPLASNETAFTLTRDGFEWHTEIRPSDRQHVDWNYHIESTDQTSSSGVSEQSDSQSASLSHTIQFGRALRSSLDSAVSWSEVTGVFPQDIERWTETLKLQHTDKFETNYQYVAERQDFDGLEQTRQRGTAGFRHQLYDSLTTVGRVGAQHLALADDSTTEEYFASLDFNYHKKAPLGLLITTMNLGWDQEDNSTRTEVLPVRNQPFVFSSFAPVTIQQQNILSNTVALRDLGGQIFFPGDGYTVTDVPGGIQLTPIPGGPITIGEPLFLSYDIGAVPENTVITDTFNIGVRYEFQRGPLKGLSPYYRFGLVDQSVSGGEGDILPNNLRRHVFGVDYRIWDFTFKAERELVDSDLFPYNTDRLEARYDHRINAGSTLSLLATWTSTEYPDLHNTVDTTLVTGSYMRQLSRQLSASISASWLHLDDQIGGTTNGMEQQLQVTWTHRQTQVYGRLRNSKLDTDRDERSFQYLEIGLRREF